ASVSDDSGDPRLRQLLARAAQLRANGAICARRFDLADDPRDAGQRRALHPAGHGALPRRARCDMSGNARRWIVTFGGAGMLPGAPGTAGSFVAALLLWIVSFV